MELYQHFRAEERQMIDMLTDKARQADTQYSPILTAFLDPRDQYILKVIIGSFPSLSCHFFGGGKSERQRAIIAPDYFEPELDDFEISLIDIDYPEKFVTIQHQHVLGTLMSLGIERDQIGDIIVGERIQFVLTNQIKSYIMMELTHIKGAAVKLNAVSIENMIKSKEQWQTHLTTVSGMRLDVVMKEMIRKSRTISQALIQRKRVKVNHTLIESVDFQLDEGDLLSIQGYGRARVVQIGERTKKDKIRLTYQTLFK
ncbi:RNA-binding protein [Staphylococcus hyicus]|uniref:YlmH family RNA-binding protein n=1 Tax=Staphylococcus hyicus TaxID=1284 RepID=UPI00211CCEFF|nr:RNA-binding protein [Staphylococcus hyicus]MCQ9290491.1 RNA-binding protein [Staphylococcus hyicus]MCQ9305733.1 RNA-binding protein [Staphylococcus hyicus]MCQ9308145.1 RNA-binding protein [Staphylococcus hyicus]MCQ9310567.1 RNA-binding protein [Staphylococcus hyicus]